MDVKKLRKAMVENQLIQRGIKDRQVLAAFQKVPRHEFVPEDLMMRAYDDCALPIGGGQTISQPYMVALMTESLQLSKTDRVLEVGTGSGYQTAILAELSAEVYTIEYLQMLSHKAREKLERMGYQNIHFAVGDGSEGWKDFSINFNAIIVTAGAPDKPGHLLRQLASDGRMVIPVGSRVSQMLMLYARKENHLEEKEICACVFVPLIGKYGWQVQNLN